MYLKRDKSGSFIAERRSIPSGNMQLLENGGLHNFVVCIKLCCNKIGTTIASPRGLRKVRE